MEKPDYVHIAFIAAKPQQTWAAIIDRELSKKYFFGNSFEVGATVGAPFCVRKPDGTIDVEGEVLAIDPPHRLRVSWQVVWLPDLPKVSIEYRIDDRGEAVRLSVSEFHGGPIPEKLRDSGRDGWALILSGIKTILETGTPLPPIKPLAPA